MAEEQGPEARELQRLRAENGRLSRELAEANERFEHSFRNELVGVLVARFDTGRYSHVNDEYCRLVGYSREELLAIDPYQFWIASTFADDIEPERIALQRMMAGETEGYRLQKRYLRRGDGPRWGELWARGVRDDSGRLKFAIISLLDIQDHRTALEARDKLESSLTQARKLESIGRLVGGVAHDFNNRLLVIMGYADLLKRGVLHNPTLAEHAEVVVDSARRAADLTRQLLAYSRRQVLRPRASDLNAVVDGTRRMIERVIGERIELVTVLGAVHPMLADPGQIDEVLMNLMLNARDAMPEGGRVTVETSDVLVTPEAPIEGLAAGPYVALSVTDTGTGIPEAARDHVFEPFFTTKEVGKGTGLGLASVDGIVRQSGGSVTLDTAEGRGSTFTVYLPRAPASTSTDSSRPETGDAEPAPRSAKAVETVLVVDDQDDVRQLLVDVLRIGAYNVLEARDGDHALELADSLTAPLDLLVTDIVMPGMTGMEIADRLRARHPALKVLFMSGYAERERVRKLDEREQFIPKPFVPAELFRRVSEFLRKPAAAAMGETSA
jgi:two-component system cell cycle sensor histidine kinase/response regulator CckA